MDMMVFCPDSFIVQDVFAALVQEPEKYNISSLRGLNQLCDLGIDLCVKKVKSLRGSYFQAKLIGLCMSSGYYKIHKNNICRNETVFDLINMLGHMGTHFEKEIRYSVKQSPEKIMRIHLIRGFEDGVRLGKRIHKRQRRMLSDSKDVILAIQRDLKERECQKYPIKIIKQPYKRRTSVQKREKVRG